MARTGGPRERGAVLRPDPGLNLASSAEHRRLPRPDAVREQRPRSRPRRPPPAYGDLLAGADGGPFLPDVFVFDKDFENPRTFNATVELRARARASACRLRSSYTHARTDHLTRFVNRNDAGVRLALGAPAWRRAARTASATLTVVESTAKSRYNGITARAAQRSLEPHLQFQVNYTLSFDKSDDDNERDPFTFRYARADSLRGRVQLERSRPASPVQRLGAARSCRAIST